MAPLFSMSRGEEEDGVRSGKRGMGSDGQSYSKGPAADLETRVAKLEELTTSMAQLQVIHDGRIRELGTMVRVGMIPKGKPAYEWMERTNEKWKTEWKEYNKRKAKGEDPVQLGNKHLVYGATLFEFLHGSKHTQADTSN